MRIQTQTQFEVQLHLEFPIRTINYSKVDAILEFASCLQIRDFNCIPILESNAASDEWSVLGWTDWRMLSVWPVRRAKLLEHGFKASVQSLPGSLHRSHTLPNSHTHPRNDLLLHRHHSTTSRSTQNSKFAVSQSVRSVMCVITKRQSRLSMNVRWYRACRQDKWPMKSRRVQNLFRTLDLRRYNG